MPQMDTKSKFLDADFAFGREVFFPLAESSSEGQMADLSLQEGDHGRGVLFIEV